MNPMKLGEPQVDDKQQHIYNSLLSKNIMEWINWSTYFEEIQL